MDDPSTGWLIGSGAALLLLRTLLGVADSNLVLVGRSRIRQLGEEGHRGAQRLDGLLEERHRLHASLSVCRTSMSVLLGAITVWLSAAYFPENRSGQVCILVLAIGVVLFAEMAGRRLAWINPERLGVALVPFYLVVHRLATPFVEVFSALASGVTRGVGSPAAQQHDDREVTEEDIRLMVEVGSDLEESEKEMIHSIFELGETLAREIMMPRVDMVAVPLDTPLEKVLDMSLEHGLSRMPVYDQTVDNIVGIVSSKDLLRLVKEQRMDTPLRDIVRVAHFVPGSKKVDDLLREMQREKLSMAIVVDEYGGTDGLITMEDLIEEIVGEITDEYDKEAPDVQALPDGSVAVNARMIIEDVNKLLGTAIPADEYETIGGFVYGLLGHVPTQGEETRVDGIIIHVEGIHRQRITQVRIEHEDHTPFVLPEGTAAARVPEADGAAVGGRTA